MLTEERKAKVPTQGYQVRKESSKLAGQDLRLSRDWV